MMCRIAENILNEKVANRSPSTVVYTLNCKLVLTSRKLIRMAHMQFMLARHLGYYIFYTYALLNCTIAYSYASYYSHSQHATLHISYKPIHFNVTYK